MASKEKQTEKSRFPSIYAPSTFITSQQYILEIICQRKASFNKQTLPIYFWRNPIWALFYKRWLRIVYKLSKQYSAKAILAALQDERAKYKWSLETDFMKSLIKEKWEQFEQEKNKIKDSLPIEIASGNTFGENISSKEIKQLEELD